MIFGRTPVQEDRAVLDRLSFSEHLQAIVDELLTRLQQGQIAADILAPTTRKGLSPEAWCAALALWRAIQPSVPKGRRASALEHGPGFQHCVLRLAHAVDQLRAQYKGVSVQLDLPGLPVDIWLPPEHIHAAEPVAVIYPTKQQSFADSTLLQQPAMQFAA